MDKSLFEIIVCPVCQGKLDLTKDESKLICRFDRLAYQMDDGIPVLLANKAESLTGEQLETLL
jgi:uncharacterized protein YbaR (Trm112 family)